MNHGRVCVGGHDIDSGFRSIRLLTRSGMNMPEDKPLAIGDVWELTYSDHEDPDPPHVEDVLISEGSKVDYMNATELQHLAAHVVPWRGDPTVIFDGTVESTPSGRAYVPEGGPLPSASTGYWEPDASIVKRIAFEKVKFTYWGSSMPDEFTWAGVADPPREIAAGTLVRVSLARWFSPPSAPAGYYVQISGVY
jgi:hypothetical protein